MAVQPELMSEAPATRGVSSVARWLRRKPLGTLVLLAIIWGVLPFVPAESGLRFGLGFQVFFSVVVVLSAIFFWFLGQERIPAPSSGLGVFASVAGVYLATVGLLIALSALAPQFGLPEPMPEGTDLSAVQRGKALFSNADVGCFRCHAIGGRGGTRGPDLSHAAASASERVSGLSAEEYLLEKIKAGATYEFKVPEYVPIMPAFGQMLSVEELADLVAYLMTLK